MKSITRKGSKEISKERLEGGHLLIGPVAGAPQKPIYVL
jgi:hypothetical protein